MCPMRVKNNRGDLAGENGATHRFPVGMHVLAVDDDKTCLEILEKMLRKCEYQVTTESRAVEALRMLRENRNKYDLVISDVKMPDIGGMELLKVVGLEMDLPVIMLSAYGDTELVMEGITHGACDYLLKPVRIQELKNIWQHVIRRRKFEAPSHCPDPLGAKDGGLGPTSSGNDYRSENSNRKRKDHIQEDEEEDGEEDGPEDDDDDSSRQKKPRVVWSMELHQKFVVAVSQLGLDKAVPKKILDLMNVERLTRENVASHLQKFRIYLKKMQDKRVGLGGKSSSYMPTMSALDGFRDFHSSGGSGRFLHPSLSSYPQGGRLNSLPGLGLRPSGLIQPQNLSSSLSNLQSAILPSNQSSNLFQGFPSSLDYKEFSSINDPTSSVGCSSKSIVNAPSNPLMTLRHQSCIEFGASNGSSWQSDVQLGTFPSNSLPSSEPFDQSHQVLLPNSFLDTFSLTTSHISSNPMEMSSTSQGGLVGQKWEDHGMGYMNNTIHSLQNNFVNGAETYTSPIAQSHSGLGMGLRSGEEFLLDQTKPQDWGIESLDDLINTTDKREQRATTLLDA